jgi:uncharacterized protein with GYD domain
VPRYITFFSYSSGAVKAMVEQPSDRPAAARALVESVGGTLQSFYWMQGHHDGFFIADVPDALSAAALSAAAASTGAIASIESHEIFDGAGQAAIIDRAKSAMAAYAPPR